ncbi:Hypothetical protein I596_3246 [Dokdonella koreensis DS-123]|uniref:Uncharacterized protein n=1 Tax=Dokdonella koreensis DS-123 TaxID=1300342 RepID=A0A160DX21_9GAMM|nr:Hypothetical protein I596_3246 [Dokdonella koreensis DS-123]
MPQKGAADARTAADNRQMTTEIVDIRHGLSALCVGSHKNNGV